MTFMCVIVIIIIVAVVGVGAQSLLIRDHADPQELFSGIGIISRERPSGRGVFKDQVTRTSHLVCSPSHGLLAAIAQLACHLPLVWSWVRQRT